MATGAEAPRIGRRTPVGCGLVRPTPYFCRGYAPDWSRSSTLRIAGVRRTLLDDTVTEDVPDRLEDDLG